MRQNYKGDKRRKEELRKKKQEEKRNKRLQRTSSLPAGIAPEGPSAPPVEQGQEHGV